MNYSYLINRINNPKITNIQRMAPTRFFIDVKPVREDKEFCIEVNFCEAKEKNSIPELWYKAGYTDKILNRYICMTTYCTDKNDNCTGHFNPQTNNRHKIDFDYMLESTEENLNKLIDASVRMYEKNIKFNGGIK